MGSEADFSIDSTQCALIHTGGMIPPGADAVVMIEYTQKAREGEIEIMHSVAVGENVLQIGEDVKVMGYRLGRHLSLTIALAFVDRFITHETHYFERKAAIRNELHRTLRAELQEIDQLDVEINTLDQPGRGISGMYLTVLGTSAEGADGGQVGRGNRVNGVISLNRPASNEAAAGKNPVSHVGKIYSLLSHQIAHHIYTIVEPVEEVYVWLCSQIGAPIETPWVTAVQVTLTPGVEVADVEERINDIVHAELADIPTFTARLTRGELPVW